MRSPWRWRLVSAIFGGVGACMRTFQRNCIALRWSPGSEYAFTSTNIKSLIMVWIFRFDLFVDMEIHCKSKWTAKEMCKLATDGKIY